MLPMTYVYIELKICAFCLVFCKTVPTIQNGIFFQNCSDLLWENNVLLYKKNFWNLRLEAKNSQIFWDHSKNLFKQWKFSSIFETECFFNLFLEVSFKYNRTMRIQIVTNNLDLETYKKYYKSMCVCLCMHLCIYKLHMYG